MGKEPLNKVLLFELNVRLEQQSSAAKALALQMMPSNL
jgi:hypothetical protein